MCPLEKGVRGIETGHQMPGRSWRAGKATQRWKATAAMESHAEMARAAARSPREDQALPLSRAPPSSAEQGIIRCRAGVGGQGSHCGDGKPVGPDRPLEKGAGRIEMSKSSRGQPYCLSLRRNLQTTEYQPFNQNQSWIFGNSENA